MANLAPDYLTNPANFATPEERIAALRDRAQALPQQLVDNGSDIPDVITKAAAKPDTSFGGALMAGASAGLNSAAYGIPDAAQSLVTPNDYAAMQATRAAHPIATGIGTGLGLGAGLFTGATEAKVGQELGELATPLLGPGGLVGLGGRIIKGAGNLAGKVSEGVGGALNTAGEAVNGAARFMAGGGKATSMIGKIGQGAVQGAMTGAEQNIAPVIGGQETPLQGLTGTALGAGVGAVASGAAGVLARKAGVSAKPMEYTPSGSLPPELDNVEAYQAAHPEITDPIEAEAARSQQAAQATANTLPLNAEDLTAADKKLLDTYIASKGITFRDMTKATGAGLSGSAKVGAQANQAYQMKLGVWHFLQDQAKANGTEAQNLEEIQQLIKGLGDRFEKSSSAAEANGTSVLKMPEETPPEGAVQINPELDDQYAQLPEVQTLQNMQGGDEAYKTFVANLQAKGVNPDFTPNLTEQRAFLADTAHNAFQGGTTALQRQEGTAAQAIKDALDNNIGQTDPAWSQMKQDWRNVQPLRYAEARGLNKMEKIDAVGSPTMARTFIANALMSGGGIGGVAGAATTFDINDPDTWAPSAAILAAGLLGGNIAGKLITSGSTGIAGEIANQLMKGNNWLKNTKFAQFVGSTLKPAIDDYMKSGAYKGAVPGSGAGLDAASGVGLASGRSILQRGASMLPEANANPAVLAALNKPTTPDEQQTQAAASGVSEPDKQEAIGQVNQKYWDILNQKLEGIYNAEYARFMTPQEFQSKMAGITNNFDPLQTEKILFQGDPAAQKAYLNDYQTALSLKQMNPAQAYDNKPGFLDIGPQRALKQEGYDKLIGIIAQTVTPGTDRVPSAHIVKSVKDNVDSVMRLPISADEKNQRLLQMMHDQYGFGRDTLQQLGFID